MKITKFDRKKWNLQEFDQVGYDKKNDRFVIYYFNGKVQEFSNFKEELVFQFVIAKDKETFIKQKMMKYCSYTTYWKKASISG